MSSWALEGAERVTIGPTTEAVAVEVPLLRGDGDPRPKVAGIVDERDDVLVVVDLVTGPTTIGSVLAARLGLVVTGRDERRTTIERLRVGDLVLEGLRAEVGSGEELVLGLRALPELAAAIVASAGEVRFVRAADGEALLAAIGPVVPLDGGAVAGALGDLDGRLRLRTDRPTSSVPRRPAGERVPAGVPETWTLAEVAGVALPAAWWRTDESGDPTVLGELGADGLAFVDLAVAGDHVAIAPALRPRWSDAAAMRLAWTEHGAAGWADPEPGDDLLARARWGELARARWAVGDAAGAVSADRRLAKVAGDRCELQLAIGERALRAGLDGAPFLERAAALWGDRVNAPIRQPTECARAAVLLDPPLDGEGELRLRIDRGARLDPVLRTALAAGLSRSGREEPALAFAARAPRLPDPHPLTTALALAEGVGDDALRAGMAADPGWVAGRVVAEARGLAVDGDLDDLVEVLRVRAPGSAAAACAAALHDALRGPAEVPDRPEADCLVAAALLAEARSDPVGAGLARDALASRWPELRW